MKKNNNLKEIQSLLFKISDSEEKESFSHEKIFEILEEIEELYQSIDKALQERDSSYGEAMTLLVSETDSKIKGSINNLKKDFEKQIDDVYKDLNNLDTKSDVLDNKVRDIIGTNKKELRKIIDDYESSFDKSKISFLNGIEKTIEKNIEKNIETRFKKLNNAEEKTTNSKDLSDFKSEIINRIAGIQAGGNMNRQILVGGVNPLTRYTDYNIIAGAGITITTANDDTNRRVNLTIVSSGSGNFETPVGTVDDSNTTFTVSNTPKYIIVNGGQYVVGTGLFTSYAAGTITLSSAVGTGGFIRSAY